MKFIFYIGGIMESFKIVFCIFLIVRQIWYMVDPKTYGDNDDLEFLHVVGIGLSIAALILALGYLLLGSRDTYNLIAQVTCISLLILLVRKNLQCFTH